jgi:hypothetical protein
VSDPGRRIVAPRICWARAHCRQPIARASLNAEIDGHPQIFGGTAVRKVLRAPRSDDGLPGPIPVKTGREMRGNVGKSPAFDAHGQRRRRLVTFERAQCASMNAKHEVCNTKHLISHAGARIWSEQSKRCSRLKIDDDAGRAGFRRRRKRLAYQQAIGGGERDEQRGILRPKRRRDRDAIGTSFERCTHVIGTLVAPSARPSTVISRGRAGEQAQQRSTAHTCADTAAALEGAANLARAGRRRRRSAPTDRDFAIFRARVRRPRVQRATGRARSRRRVHRR